MEAGEAAPDEVDDVDEALRRGLTAAGTTTDVGRITAALKKLDSTYLPPRRSLDRWISDGIPKAPKEASRDLANRLASLIEVSHPEWADRFRVLLKAEWDGPKAHKQRHRSATDSVETAPGLRRQWFGVIPRQDGRDYASIDLVTITELGRAHLSGTMERLSPPKERALRWSFAGTYDTDEAIFLSFSPETTANSRSRGVIALARLEYRQHEHAHYDGSYSRQPDDERGLTTRIYHWHQRIPNAAMHHTALLDLDRTLRPEWLVQPWLKFLGTQKKWSAAGKVLADVGELIASFHEHEIDHDELVERCEGLYAGLMTGRSEREVQGLAAVFFNPPARRRGFFDYVHPLIDELTSRWISPIIISGAPAELVDLVAKELGLEQSFGLQLSVDGGLYDGSIASNPGTSAGKDSVVATILSQNREVLLAVGDSLSDAPLWGGSPNAIVVGDGPVAEWMPDDAFHLNPNKAGAWPKLERWLDTVLPAAASLAPKEPLDG